jgi:hypothetical protein
LSKPDGNFEGFFCWILLLVEECSAENGLALLDKLDAAFAEKAK